MIDINKDAQYIFDSMAGSLIIDTAGRVKFMSRDLLDTIGVDLFEDVKDKKIQDVIGTNTICKVLETGKEQIGETYFVHGYTIISNAYPIYKKGELVGAVEYDCFQDIDNLHEFLDKISNEKDFKAYTDTLTGRKKGRYSLDSIKGSSQVTKDIKNEIKMASRSNSTVLISGETGTGKELIAQAIHYGGHRALFEFVEVNCATIPSELFESELFGYEEGSFTGAKKGGKKGLAEVADRGTLFLDEIDTLPINLQGKLLRFLQEKEIQRIGGSRTIPLDIRIITATNADLNEMVENGKFRNDLYYRLNVIEIAAKPLRNRITDIAELVNFFIDRFNVELGRQREVNWVKNIDTKALKQLMNYDWPGNIRELQNAVERAMNRCIGQTLETEHFDERFMGSDYNEIEADGKDLSGTNLKDMTKRIEKAAIIKLLSEQGLTVKQAASKLGISRQMLHRKMNEYNIKSTKQN